MTKLSMGNWERLSEVEKLKLFPIKLKIQKNMHSDLHNVEDHKYWIVLLINNTFKAS